MKPHAQERPDDTYHVPLEFSIMYELIPRKAYALVPLVTHVREVRNWPACIL